MNGPAAGDGGGSRLRGEGRGRAASALGLPGGGARLREALREARSLQPPARTRDARAHADTQTRARTLTRDHARLTDTDGAAGGRWRRHAGGAGTVMTPQ